MPIIESAKKALRQTHRRTHKNKLIKERLKKSTKEFTAALEAGEIARAQELLPTVYKRIDKATKKGVLKKNTASRKKSRLARTLTKKAAS